MEVICNEMKELTLEMLDEQLVDNPNFDIKEIDVVDETKISYVRDGQKLKLKLNSSLIFIRGKFDKLKKKYPLVNKERNISLFIKGDSVCYTNFINRGKNV